MEYLKSLVAIEEFIEGNDLAFVYFSTEACNVCKDLFPKIEAMLKRYPEIKLARVDMNEVTEAAGKYSVFTIPTILFFINGDEAVRKGRFISMDELEEGISRYYNMVVEG